MASGDEDLDDLKAFLATAGKRTMNFAVCQAPAGADGRADVANERERTLQRNATRRQFFACGTAHGSSLFNDIESSTGLASVDVAAAARNYRTVMEKVLI